MTTQPSLLTERGFAPVVIYMEVHMIIVWLIVLILAFGWCMYEIVRRIDIYGDY